MDITNDTLISYGVKIKKYSLKRSAKNLMKIVKNHDFTLYEYFLTDLYGHKRGTIKDIHRVLSHINKFTEYLIKNANLENEIIVISSDHGNIEDISHKSHTRNPVPLIIFSKEKFYLDFLNDRINSIADVTPAIVELLKE